MASIVITIETDGAAFHDNRSIAMDRLEYNNEIARVLRRLATRFSHLSGDVVPIPRNGIDNICGTVEVIE